MNELSDRFRQAVDFLKKIGYTKNGVSVAERIGYPSASIYMCMKGTRVPTWDLLLAFSDAFPIDFDWLRTGKGCMVRLEIVPFLVNRIEELEAEIDRMG